MNRSAEKIGKAIAQPRSAIRGFPFPNKVKRSTSSQHAPLIQLTVIHGMLGNLGASICTRMRETDTETKLNEANHRAKRSRDALRLRGPSCLLGVSHPSKRQRKGMAMPKLTITKAPRIPGLFILDLPGKDLRGRTH